jgi:hypothetical protein
VSCDNRRSSRRKRHSRLVGSRSIRPTHYTEQRLVSSAFSQSWPLPLPTICTGFTRLPFLAADFHGHCFRLIPASYSFAASAFPVPPLHDWVLSHKAADRFGSSSPRFWVPQKIGQEKRENSVMCYLYVKWNSLHRSLPADVSDIRARFVLRWPLP